MLGEQEKMDRVTWKLTLWNKRMVDRAAREGRKQTTMIDVLITKVKGAWKKVKVAGKSEELHTNEKQTQLHTQQKR